MKQVLFFNLYVFLWYVYSCIDKSGHFSHNYQTLMFGGTVCTTVMWGNNRLGSKFSALSFLTAGLWWLAGKREIPAGFTVCHETPLIHCSKVWLFTWMHIHEQRSRIPGYFYFSFSLPIFTSYLPFLLNGKRVCA